MKRLLVAFITALITVTIIVILSPIVIGLAGMIVWAIANGYTITVVVGALLLLIAIFTVTFYHD